MSYTPLWKLFVCHYTSIFIIHIHYRCINVLFPMSNFTNNFCSITFNLDTRFPNFHISANERENFRENWNSCPEKISDCEPIVVISSSKRIRLIIRLIMDILRLLERFYLWKCPREKSSLDKHPVPGSSSRNHDRAYSSEKLAIRIQQPEDKTATIAANCTVIDRDHLSPWTNLPFVP